MHRLLRFIFCVVLITQINSCGHKGIYSKGYYSGRDTKPPKTVHIIKRGETLYSLAWQYGYDYREVAKWNDIAPPYTIYPKQKLRIRPTRAENRLANSHSSKQKLVSRAKNNAVALQSQPTTRVHKPATKQYQQKVRWSWPTKGKILTSFSSNDPGRKGIDIGGKAGQAIHAAAPGRVVYSGSGLRGYGKLIIIKHNETFFSAYAHNRDVVIKEGQSVKKSERIADMGRTGTDRVKLHFEIRRNGIPVNPFYYLPKQ